MNHQQRDTLKPTYNVVLTSHNFLDALLQEFDYTKTLTNEECSQLFQTRHHLKIATNLLRGLING